MAETYHCRPSELLGVEDAYSAWCLDEVTYAWGMAVDGAASRAREGHESAQEATAAASAELQRLFRDTEGDEEKEEVVTTGRFRDPAPDFAAARARRRPK